MLDTNTDSLFLLADYNLLRKCLRNVLPSALRIIQTYKHHTVAMLKSIARLDTNTDSLFLLAEYNLLRKHLRNVLPSVLRKIQSYKHHAVTSMVHVLPH